MATELSLDLFPPGEYIRDELDARGWTQEDLADIMGRPSSFVSKIVGGTKQITRPTAQQLAAAFGTSAELWLNLENAHRLALEREDQSDIQRRAKIYGKAPVAELLRRHWMPPCETTAELEREVLAFLEIPTLDAAPQLEAAARMSADYDETAASQIAWLCRVKRLADSLPAANFTRAKMDKHLDSLHALTTSEQELRKVPAILSEMGIRFLVVQHLPRTKIDGYTLWLDKKSPVIALSLRYDRIDGFWHTLAHELSHVRHGDRAAIDNNLVGAGRDAPRDDVEKRADREASEWLVPAEKIQSFIARTRPRYSKRRIRQFAQLHQIHPGIVAGQLQYRGETEYRHNREMLVGVRDIITETALTDGWGHVPSL